MSKRRSRSRSSQQFKMELGKPQGVIHPRVEAAGPERFGIVVRHPDGTLAEIIEKPEHPPSNLASTGVMVLDDNLFKYELTKETNGEYYLTDIIAEYAKDYPIAVVEQQLWIPIGYPEDIEKAEKILAAHPVDVLQMV